MGRYSDLVISDGGANLLGYWTLDAEFGLTDKSSGAHNGTGQGGVTIGTATAPGQLTATDFDGADDGVTTTLNPFTNGTVRSFELWAKRDTHGSADALFYGGNSRSPELYLDATIGRVNFFADTGVPTGVARWTSTFGADGVWTYLMMVFNEPADTVALYTNGVLVNSQSMPAAYNASPGTFQISTGDPFDGKICHVAVYNGDQSAFALSHYLAGRAFADSPTGAVAVSGSRSESHSAAVSPAGNLAAAGSITESLSSATTPAGVLALNGAITESRGKDDVVSGTLALTLHMRESQATYHPGSATYGGTPGVTYGGGTTSTYQGGTADTYSLSRSSSYDQEY